MEAECSSPAWARRSPTSWGSPGVCRRSAASLSFGKYDALVDLLQSTPPDKLQPILVEKLNSGETDLKQLIAAGALANAETFGGEDYVGFHTAMAMLPALQMTELLPTERRPLPVLKVLYRNSQQIQQYGGASKKTLREMHAAEEATVENAAIAIRDACRVADVEQGREALRPAGQGLARRRLQRAAAGDAGRHQRAPLRVRPSHARPGRPAGQGPRLHDPAAVRPVLLRARARPDQRNKRAESPIRALMPKLLDQYKLAGKKLGTRDPGDAAVEELARTIYQGPPERSAEAAAAALAEGISPEVVGEAISLASNLLVLRQGPDEWRTHGDSAGVHSSDATNAWRNMARMAQPQHAVSGLDRRRPITSAAHKPFTDRGLSDRRAPRGDQGDRSAKACWPKPKTPCGTTTRAGPPRRSPSTARAATRPKPVYERMLKYTISEDGRLHGEKYFHTVQEEYRTTRPAFRWRQIVGLARVTASAYGYDREDKHGGRAPGYEEACRLLKVTA